MREENKGFVVHNSTPQTFNQYTYSLDDKVTQKPTSITHKKEVFSEFNNSEIAKSHTIKYSTPTTHIVTTDRKYDMSKVHTEYFQNPSSKEVHSGTAVNEPSASKPSTVSTGGAINEPKIVKPEASTPNKTVFTSEEIKFVPFSITTYGSYKDVQSETSRVPEGSPVIHTYKPTADYVVNQSDAPSFDKPMTIDLGHANKHISNKILNENTSRINESSATNTDKPFSITRKDMINTSYVKLQDRMDNAIVSGLSTIAHTAYRTLESGEENAFTTARKIKDGVVVVTSINATGRTIGRQAGNVNRILSDNTTRLQNVGKYVKGQEKKDFKEFNPYTQKQLNQKLAKFSDLTERRMSSINREIKELKKIKVQLSPEQQKRLAYLLNYKDLKKQGKLLLEDKQAMKGLGFVVKNGMYALMRSNDNSGIEAMMTATEFVGNRYTRMIVTGTAKGTYNVTKFGVKTTGNVVKFVSDKTGLTRQINKGTAKLMETKVAQTTKTAVEAVHHGIHGGVYNAAKKQVILYTPDKFKNVVSTTQKVTKTTANVVNKGVVKPVKTAGKFIKKGYHIASTPFRWAKKATAFVKIATIKTLKWLLLGLFGLIIVSVLLSAAMGALTAVTSVFATDTPNIQEYANYIIELQNNELQAIEEDLARLREEHDSLNDPVYYYTHKESLSNGKEILSMAAVWNQQEWPEWYHISENIELKTYIDTLFDKSHKFKAIIGEEYECSGCKEREEERTRYYSHSSGCKTDADGNSYCPGHSRTYTVTVIYCDGHRDVDVQVTVFGFDEIFNYDEIGHDPDPSRNWLGWWYRNDDGTLNTSNMDWAKHFYNQDWLELYGINFAGSAFTPDPITTSEKQEIMDRILEQYPDLSEERINLVETALSLVGRVPYFWGGGHHQNLEPGLDLAWGVEQRVVWADGYDAQPAGSYQLYGLDCSGFTRWAILTSTGSDSMYYGAQGQRTHSSAISVNNLQPGDFANTSDDGHVGIYLYTLNGRMYFVHCSPSVDGVGINAPGYFTKYYRPNGISS